MNPPISIQCVLIGHSQTKSLNNQTTWAPDPSKSSVCTTFKNTLLQIALYCSTIQFSACRLGVFAICIWGAINSTLVPTGRLKRQCIQIQCRKCARYAPFLHRVLVGTSSKRDETEHRRSLEEISSALWWWSCNAAVCTLQWVWS